MSDKINMDDANWKRLVEIAKYAIGSKEAEARGKIKGGEGRIGMIDGHVIKFNTHASERLKGPKAGLEMFASCNALRRNLYNIAQSLLSGSRGDALKSIRSKLGLNENGGVVKATKLLDRKVVASVINLIGDEVQEDVWSSLRVDEIKNKLASTQPGTDGKMEKKDMHFQAVVDRLKEAHQPVGQRDEGQELNESVRDPREIVIVNDVHEKDVLEESQAPMEELKSGGEVEERKDSTLPIPNPVDVDEKTEEPVAERQVVDEAPIVQSNVETVQEAFVRLNGANPGNVSTEKWIERIANGDFFKGVAAQGASLTDKEADDIIRKQVVGGTGFGLALKTTRAGGEDNLGKASGALETSMKQDLGSARQSLFKAIERYLAFADVGSKFGGPKKDAAMVCRQLMNGGAHMVMKTPDLRLCMAVNSVESAVHQEKKSTVKLEFGDEDAKKVVRYLVDAAADFGLDLDEIKNSQGEARERFEKNLASYRDKASSDVKKRLWEAILGYVEIDPAQSGSDRGAPGEVGKEEGVNQRARDAEWAALLNEIRAVEFIGDDANNPVSYRGALNRGVEAICEKVGSMKLTSEQAKAIIADQVVFAKTTKFGNILNKAKRVGLLGTTAFTPFLIKQLKEDKDAEGSNKNLLMTALIDEMEGV